MSLVQESTDAMQLVPGPSSWQVDEQQSPSSTLPSSHSSPTSSIPFPQRVPSRSYASSTQPRLPTLTRSTSVAENAVLNAFTTPLISLGSAHPGSVPGACKLKIPVTGSMLPLHVKTNESAVIVTETALPVWVPFHVSLVDVGPVDSTCQRPPR